LVGADTFASKLTASEGSFPGILEVELANDVDNDLSLQGTLLGVANNALVLSLGFKTMPLFELAILGIFCHGCLWFVFDQGNPNGFPKSQTPAFTFYAPHSGITGTCPNRKWLVLVDHRQGVAGFEDRSHAEI
jgi:hypothetical protein